MDRANLPTWRRSPVAVALATIASLALATLIALAVPATAHADKLASKRAEASKIARQVDQLNIRLSDLDEVARSDAAALASANARLHAATEQLAITRASLRDGRAQLLARLVSVYETGSVDQSVLQLVSAGSLSNFLTRVDDVKNVSSVDARIVSQLKSLKQQVVAEKAALTIVQAKAQKLSARATKSRDAAAAQTAKRQALLNSVQRDIRHLVYQQQQAELARQRAEALVQKEQQASLDAGAHLAPAGGTSSGLFSNPLVDPNAGSGSGVGAQAASVAERYLGVPYVWGGASPSGFDCSGLVMYAFGQVGVSLPHLTYAQFGMGTHIGIDQLQRGDIVFFDGEAHEGLYLGGGEFIHAPHTGTVVQIASLSGYWASAFAGAVRIG